MQEEVLPVGCRAFAREAGVGRWLPCVVTGVHMCPAFTDAPEWVTPLVLYDVRYSPEVPTAAPGDTAIPAAAVKREAPPTSAPGAVAQDTVIAACGRRQGLFADLHALFYGVEASPADAAKVLVPDVEAVARVLVRPQ